MSGSRVCWHLHAQGQHAPCKALCPCSCCRRAGRDPAGDSQRHPLQGTPATAVTGEAVVVRRAPDLEALQVELQRVLDAGGRGIWRVFGR